MTVLYRYDVQTSRMVATRDAIDSGGAAGALELCTAGYAVVIASFTLGYPGNSTGVVSGTTLTLAGFPKSVTAASDGVAAVARVRRSDGEYVITGLTVGTADAEDDVVEAGVVLRADTDTTQVVSPRARTRLGLLDEDTHFDVEYTADIWTSASIDIRTAATAAVTEQRDDVCSGGEHRRVDLLVAWHL